ncbi:unnamed protein product [Adineta steineri]|uniref:Uncharacterized protein n=1 Tax=Adineta steineri TaxID=433720 RepID=A0A819CBL1_9BILA|nr:unnamed protein product [Adineta steineri]CAF3812029.1 unnamed protein product [Adineta steineri]
MSENKIMNYDQTIKLVKEWCKKGERIVFTNGCFDIVHLGHIDYLEKARQLGDKLIVALNTDKSTSQIKGLQRPVINEYARARHMAALQFVDIVTLFDELTPIILIEAIQPNILVKGGDYTNETIIGADFVIQNGGTVQTIPLIREKIRSGLIASGSILVDYIVSIDDWPMENCTAFIQDKVQMTNGGAPYNIVKNLRTMKVDFPLLLIRLIENDFNGKWIIDDYIKSNIDINQLEITSCTYVMSVKNTNRRTFFHQQGTNGLLDEKHFNFSGTNAKLFYLGPLTQLNRLDTFNNNDKRTNASKVLENAPLHAKSSLPFIDHLIINETEAGLIFTKNITSDNLYEIKQIANDLIDSGVRKTVTIHFTEGAILMTNDKNLFLQGSIILPEEFEGVMDVGVGVSVIHKSDLHPHAHSQDLLPEDETVLERIVELKEIFPESVQNSVGKSNRAVINTSKFAYIKGRTIA